MYKDFEKHWIMYRANKKKKKIRPGNVHEHFTDFTNREDKIRNIAAMFTPEEVFHHAL